MAPDVNTFTYHPSDKYNSGQSAARHHSETDYPSWANQNQPFLTSIQNEALSIDPTTSLTASQLMLRAQALSCAGCHNLTVGKNLGHGIFWPASLDFVHVSEKDLESSPDHGGLRFKLSPALEDVFLPARLKHMEEFLSAVHPDVIPRDLSDKPLPLSLRVNAELCSRDYRVWRHVWPWEEVEALRIDLGPKVNNQAVH